MSFLSYYIRIVFFLASRQIIIRYTSVFVLAVNILSDIIQNPVLDEGAIERERGVILREMQVRNLCFRHYFFFISILEITST